MPDKHATYATRPIRPELQALLDGLQPGQRLRITQTVRVGMKSWPAVVTGAFRHVDSLATGLATDRVPADNIVVPIILWIETDYSPSVPLQLSIYLPLTLILSLVLLQPVKGAVVGVQWALRMHGFDENNPEGT